ncbi:MAG TPA: hypothetical protein VK662_05290 [Acidothermaceae bacterium]|nr:hypothetical protein [Acidothermaceae bacterium]
MPPQVLGQQFTNNPPAAAPGAATLPFTGAAVPLKSATDVAAGLVVAGAAAVLASRRRPYVAQHAGRPVPGNPIAAQATPTDMTDTTDTADTAETSAAGELPGTDLPSAE